MKSYFLQRCTYLGWLLLALTASVGVKAAQPANRATIKHNLNKLRAQTKKLAEEDLKDFAHEEGLTNCKNEAAHLLLLLNMKKQRLQTKQDKQPSISQMADGDTDNALHLDHSFTSRNDNGNGKSDSAPDGADDDEKYTASTDNDEEKGNAPDLVPQPIDPNTAKETRVPPFVKLVYKTVQTKQLSLVELVYDTVKKQQQDRLLSKLLNDALKEKAQPLVKLFNDPEKKKEEILFEFFYDAKKADGGLNWGLHGNLSDQEASAYAETIFKIGAYYVKENPDTHKDKLLYYFFRPYEASAANQDERKSQNDLAEIEKRIANEKVYKAFVKALASQHKQFMHGFITRWLWDKDPIRRYCPSIWYFYSTPLAKLYQFSSKSTNYQGLRVCTGMQVNHYTQAIEGQREAILKTLYPSYTIYHTIRIILMYMTIVRIVYLFIKLKKQRDNFTLAPGIKRKNIYSRVRGDLRSMLLDLFREVPWLQDYVLADTPGVINEIGGLFNVLLLFFSWPIPSANQ